MSLRGTGLASRTSAQSRWLCPWGSAAEMRWLRHWGPPVVWAVIIWFLSTQEFSAAATSRILFPLLRWLLPHASPGTLEALHFAIRKSVHFFEYFIFSLLLLRAIRGDRKGWRLSWALVTVAVAACYAALDEVHQAFASGRTASPLDSLLDSSGAVVAQVLAWVYALWQARRLRREPANELP